MSFLLLTFSQTFAAEPCFDLIERYAAENCLSIPDSYEVDLGDGPVITFDCDLDADFGQSEPFAAFSLAPDVQPFFDNEPSVCSGGDLWIDGGILDEPATGVVVSWLSWMMFHEWDDEREAGEMSYLDEWFVEQSITRLHRGSQDEE